MIQANTGEFGLPSDRAAKEVIRLIDLWLADKLPEDVKLVCVPAKRTPYGDYVIDEMWHIPSPNVPDEGDTSTELKPYRMRDKIVVAGYEPVNRHLVIGWDCWANSPFFRTFRGE